MDYHFHNLGMRADRFHPSKIQKILRELAGELCFSTLDFFSRYLQIRMSKQCKEIPPLFAGPEVSNLRSYCLA